MASEIVEGRDEHADMAWLVQGQVNGNTKARVATVALDLEDGRTRMLKVLVSSKGRVNEMVKTSSAVRTARLLLSTDGAANRTGAGSARQRVVLEPRRLSASEHRLRQLWRAVRTLHKQPRQRCARAGLTLTSLITDLDHAYDVACRFRANVYAQGYAGWYQEFYSITLADRVAMARRIAKWKNPPDIHIAVIKGADNTQSEIDSTIASLRAQTYPCFKIDLFEENLKHFLPLSSVPGVRDFWHIAVRAGTVLSEQALFCIADAAIKTPDAAVIYADHDTQGADRQLCDPIFKPDWSPELLRSTNYIGEAFAWNGRYAQRLSAIDDEAGNTDATHALLLALSELSPIRHLAAPLWHMTARCEPAAGDATARAVAVHLRHQGSAATVESIGPGRCRVHYPVPEPAPLVSIIVPTRDGLAHLRSCIDSVIGKTRYGAYEILVVDNQSSDPATLSYLRELQRIGNVRVLPFDEPFNYSRINNMAVLHAKGELVCLLNNDTAVISPDWLAEMVGVLSSGKVGAVGAKLLYGDGSVQHAGDTVGSGGCANHLHTGIGAYEPGYAGRALVAQDLSAVTAACLLTPKMLYQKLGGLNERKLKVAFNDVDYCLRVREMGFRVVWTPHASLYHFESRSRGKDETPAQQKRAKAEIRYMSRRWACVMQHDPFYNPNLNHMQADFGLSSAPNVFRPWSERQGLIGRIFAAMTSLWNLKTR